MKDHHFFMGEARKEALVGLEEGGLPIGSVIVHQNEIVARGHNQRIQEGSVIRHAEMDALENLGRKSHAFYNECTLYSTLSPCSMCSGAAILYQIPQVVIGENINFKGAEKWMRQEGIQLIILQDEDCIQMMQNFIQKHPHLWNEDIGLPKDH